MRRSIQTILTAISERLGVRKRRFMVECVEELPDQVKPTRLYAIGSGEPWLAAMECPCGCDGVIQLSLLEYDSPHWSLRVEPNGTGTITPSVWRTRDCRSHFFLRKGVIEWCDRTQVLEKRRFFGLLRAKGR